MNTTSRACTDQDVEKLGAVTVATYTSLSTFDPVSRRVSDWPSVMLADVAQEAPPLMESSGLPCPDTEMTIESSKPVTVTVEDSACCPRPLFESPNVKGSGVLSVVESGLNVDPLQTSNLC
jgi:hypothetical protein